MIRLGKIPLLTLISSLIFLMSPSIAWAATLALSPSTGSANRGCIMPVQIILDTKGANTDGTDAILIYDPTRFSVTTSSIVSGTIYPDFPGNTVDSPRPGTVTVSGLASVSSPFNGQGILATVNFKVLDNAPAGATSIKFDFDPADKTKTTDSNVVERGTIADVLNSVTDGNYTVGTGTCTSVGTIPKGGPTDSSSSATPTATIAPKPLPSALPQGGIEGPTFVLVISGVLLTILGVAGLALL